MVVCLLAPMHCRDRDATHHLMRVASGLDSLVLGEGQILAQVKQVHKVGQSAGPGFGRQLNGERAVLPFPQPFP